MHLPPLRLAGLVLTFAVRTLAAEPLLEKVDVFEAGTNGVALYRIPGVVVTAKGTVLAYCEARKSSGADWGEIEVHLRRSSDGGRTWDAARQIAHLGERLPGNPHKAVGGENEQTVNNPVAIVDRQTGAVHFCSFPKWGFGNALSVGQFHCAAGGRSPLARSARPPPRSTASPRRSAPAFFHRFLARFEFASPPIMCATCAFTNAGRSSPSRARISNG